VLNQRTLVLEGVTLAKVVKLVVKVLVDLAACTVLDQKASKDSQAAHPYDLTIILSAPMLPNILLDGSKIFIPGGVPWHTGISGTLSLTETTVSTDSSCSGEFTSACAGVHGNGLADDEAICNELADGLAGVGVRDFAGLIGIEPDLALSTADDGGRQTLLGCEIDPIMIKFRQLLMFPTFSTS
jgi:hypothetical protein